MKIDYIPFNPKDDREYVQQVMDTINIDLPGEEEYLAKKTLLPELEAQMLSDGICPSCGSNKTREYHQFNGPDDFDTVFICKSCGLTAV